MIVSLLVVGDQALQGYHMYIYICKMFVDENLKLHYFSAELALTPSVFIICATCAWWFLYISNRSVNELSVCIL